MHAPYIATVANQWKQLGEKTLEMQQYIDISPYRDSLGSDTVSIHI